MSSCARSEGRGALDRRPALTGALTGFLLLAGCAVSGEPESASPEPRPALAQQAEVSARNLSVGTAGDTGDHAASGPSSRRRAGAVGDRAEPVGAPEVTGGSTRRRSAAGDQEVAAPPVRDWPALTAVADPTDDHGDGPGYADLAGVSFSEHDGRLAVSVTVTSAVPARLADREVQGVGIDLYRSRSDESDYQLFLDGGAHGWRAFLRTTEGFVDFPGSFAVRGRTLEVVVPWVSLGGREDADVQVFVDWSSGVGRLSADGTTRTELRPH